MIRLVYVNKFEIKIKIYRININARIDRLT